MRLRCSECGAEGYIGKTETPEWKCSECGIWVSTSAAPETSLEFQNPWPSNLHSLDFQATGSPGRRTCRWPGS